MSSTYLISSALCDNEEPVGDRTLFVVLLDDLDGGVRCS